MAFLCLTVNAHAASRPKTILAFGDSLISGYGIPLDKAFPAQLELKMREEGYEVTVINAGVSGETTSGGLTRLEWVLEQHKPDFVILELGANDMLRAIDPKVIRENLQKMLDILKGKKVPALLAGMRSMPNLGILYSDRYNIVYKELAKKYDVVYYPFFLDGVILEPTLIQEDGLHPNAAGVAAIVDNIFPAVKKLLKKHPPE